MDNRKDLIKFLRELADSIDNNKIEEEKLVEISKFFIKFKFEENKYEESEMLKYLSLGWYIYNYLLKK